MTEERSVQRLARSAESSCRPTEYGHLRQQHLVVMAQVAVFLVIPFFYAGISVHCDNGDHMIYGKIANQVLEGKRLYGDVWEGKPPLGILFYCIPQLFAPRSYAAIQFFLGIWLAAEAMLYWCVFRPGRPASLACTLFLCLFPLAHWDSGWASTEHSSNFFVAVTLVVSYFMFRDQRFRLWQCVLCGVMSCIAFHTRQTALFSSLVPLAGIVLASQPWRKKATGLAAWIGGGLLGWAVVLVLMFLIADVPAYFRVVFFSPGVVTNSGHLPGVMFLVWGAFQTALPYLLFFFFSLVMLTPYRWLAISGLVGGLICCFAPLQHCTHYWVGLYPLIAVLIGIGLERLQSKACLLDWACVAAFTAALLPLPIFRIYFARQDPTYEVAVRVADAADRMAPPNSTILVRGPMFVSDAVSFVSRLPEYHRLGLWAYLDPRWTRMHGMDVEAIFNEVLAAPPGVMVIHDEYLRAIAGKADLPNHLQVVRLLLARHRYSVTGTQDNYAILVRKF